MPQTRRSVITEKCHKLAGPRWRKNAKNPQVHSHRNVAINFLASRHGEMKKCIAQHFCEDAKNSQVRGHGKVPKLTGQRSRFITADWSIFGIFPWPRVCGIFPWQWTCKFLAFFYDHRPASFLHFSVTADQRVFRIFPWTQTCEFVAFFLDRRPESFWHFLWLRTCNLLAFSVTAELQDFGIFLWPQPVNFWHFCDSGPASLWHFTVTADLRVLGIFS